MYKRIIPQQGIGQEVERFGYSYNRDLVGLELNILVIVVNIQANISDKMNKNDIHAHRYVKQEIYIRILDCIAVNILIVVLYSAFTKSVAEGT